MMPDTGCASTYDNNSSPEFFFNKPFSNIWYKTLTFGGCQFFGLTLYVKRLDWALISGDQVRQSIILLEIGNFRFGHLEFNECSKKKAYTYRL